MAITNYGELKAAVISRAARADLSTLVEDFVRYPHDEIVKKLVIGADLTLSSDSVYLPSDCREVVAVWPVEAATSPLRPISISEGVGTGTGAPQGYRVSNGKLILAPTPDQTYAGRIQYRLNSAFFEDDDDTNAALLKYPFIYVYGALSDFCTWNDDDPGAARYEGRFRQALEDAIAEERKQGASGAMLQSASGNVV